MAIQPTTLHKRTPNAPETVVPTVVLVDNDPLSLGQGGRVLDELGYRHRTARSAREALALLEQDAEIRIIIADAELSGMDGPTLIEEAHVRAGSKRALAAILACSRPTADMAIRGMRAGAVDCVPKPYAGEACSAALRLALRYLETRLGISEAPEADFGEQLARVITMLEARTPAPPADREIGARDVAATLRAIIGMRSLRGRHFPAGMFADPAWDILLDLSRADLDRQPVSVSSVCIAASVPMSTALRWVRQMTDAGLLQRWTDPKDRRRDLIALTDPTAESMRDYLTSVCATLRKV